MNITTGYAASDFVGSAHSIVMAEMFNHTGWDAFGELGGSA